MHQRHSRIVWRRDGQTRVYYPWTEDDGRERFEGTSVAPGEEALLQKRTRDGWRTVKRRGG